MYQQALQNNYLTVCAGAAQTWTDQQRTYSHQISAAQGGVAFGHTETGVEVHKTS